MENNTRVQDRTWDVVTVDKTVSESGETTNLFTEDEGTTSVTIALDSEVTAPKQDDAGNELNMKYTMQIRFLDAEGKIIYENTVAFE
jgi:hypothetical protein